MHFEHLVLSRLVQTRSADAWSTSVQAEIAAVTGDDAAMATLGVGADFKEFQKLLAPRVADLAANFVEPLDELSDAVTRAEQQLKALQSRYLDEMTSRWSHYKAGYERYLRPEATLDEDQEAVTGEDAEQSEPFPEQDSGGALDAPADDSTPPEGAGDSGQESTPTDGVDSAHDDAERGRDEEVSS